MKTISLSDLEKQATEAAAEYQKQQEPVPEPAPEQKPMSAGEHVEQIGRNLTETTLSLVGGDRNKAYDHPYNNMERTALIWSGILGIPVTGGQVALCMAGVKLAREAYAHKADNLVDTIGYIIVFEAWREIAEGVQKAKANAK